MPVMRTTRGRTLRVWCWSALLVASSAEATRGAVAAATLAATTNAISNKRLARIVPKPSTTEPRALELANDAKSRLKRLDRRLSYEYARRFKGVGSLTTRCLELGLGVAVACYGGALRRTVACSAPAYRRRADKSRRLAATPRPRGGYSAETSRGDAAGAARIVRGGDDERAGAREERSTVAARVDAAAAARWIFRGN